MGVPSGSFVADGISDWLGEMPVERGWRSKGSFCESVEFVALSAGGRPQAERRLSVRTINIGTINSKTIDSTTIDMRYVSDLNDIGDILRRIVWGLVPGRKIVIESSNRQSRGKSPTGGIAARCLNSGRDSWARLKEAVEKSRLSMPSPEVISKFFDVAEAMT
jgi:hypothetical protein